jgi:D-alanine-D-alanine ligase
MNRTHVLLLFGGESSEHDVSMASARNVLAAIDGEKFDITLCYIDNKGRWWLRESFESDSDDSSELLPVLGSGSFMTKEKDTIKPDVILPILHGKNGEDGSVQGLAQLLHIPIVGCDMTSSAIGMDKLASKEIAASRGVKIVPYIVHRQGTETPSFDYLKSTLGSPLFIKPSRAGSSVGVSKVDNEHELSNALKHAHEHDKVVLIEKGINARELELAVIGTPPHHNVSGVGEIIPGAEFYSYDDKYASDSDAAIVLPADVSDNVKEQLRTLAATIYEALGCSGLSRIDFFMDENDDIYFNEINTLPGFTNISMYPKLWQQEGVSYSRLIAQLIQDALANATIKTI